MESLALTSWQTVLLAVLYIGYLCWVMFGGLRRRRIKVGVYVIMTLLMVYGVVREFSGLRTVAEMVNVCIVLAVGFAKGIVLGKRKVVEKVDGKWYMRHDKKYINLWVAFFAVKILLTQLLTFITQAEFPLWHMILYFCFYYPWRTVNVFYRHPTMRREVLGRYRKPFRH